jgi:cell division protease FtsH
LLRTGELDQSVVVDELETAQIDPRTVIGDIQSSRPGHHRMAGHPTSLLFELLNQMDGLNEDIDIVFLLTTNRPQAVEPALASRPGRIDLAINMPLPDDEGRSRLLDLYGRGLQLNLRDRAAIVTATEGATPAFIREVLRRATVIAAEQGDATRIDDQLLADAIEELRQATDQIGRAVLGAPPGMT